MTFSWTNKSSVCLLLCSNASINQREDWEEKTFKNNLGKLTRRIAQRRVKNSSASRRKKKSIKQKHEECGWNYNNFLFGQKATAKEKLFSPLLPSNLGIWIFQHAAVRPYRRGARTFIQSFISRVSFIFTSSTAQKGNFFLHFLMSPTSNSINCRKRSVKQFPIPHHTNRKSQITNVSKSVCLTYRNIMTLILLHLWFVFLENQYGKHLSANCR